MKLRICSFETRSADAMRSLIERHGGVPTLVPTVQEVPTHDDTNVLEFGEQLLSGGIDVVLFLTGVGAQLVLEKLAKRYGRDLVVRSLSRCVIGVRGPKPAAVLRQWGVNVAVRANPPHTWCELVEALDSATSLQGKRVAVQEYGRSSTALHTALRRLGAAVQSVMIYRWRLPDQLEPLRDAVQGTIDGRFDVLAFTTAVQLDHVLEVAEQMGLRDQWLAAARKCLLASIGPTTSAALREVGLPVDIEPEHSKMGQLVAAIFEQAPRKKGRRSSFLEADTSSTR